jgi:hypothetical protein
MATRHQRGNHFVVCPTMSFFWLPLWCLVAIMLSALRCTSSDYPFDVLWPLCCLPYDVRLLIIPLVSCGHYVVCPTMYVFWLPLWCLVAIMLSALRCTSSDYPFDVLWPLCCLPFDVRLLIIPLVSCGHYVVCPSMYVFWLSLLCLVVILLWHQRDNQKTYIEGQTTQWPQDTKGISRRRTSKGRQHNGHKTPQG